MRLVIAIMIYFIILHGKLSKAIRENEYVI